MSDIIKLKTKTIFRLHLRPLYAHLLYLGIGLFPLFSLAENKQQLSNVLQDIAKQEQNVQQQQKQRTTLQQQLRQQDKTIAQSSRTLRYTQNTLRELNQEIRNLTQSIQQLQTQQDQQQQYLAQQLEAAFRLGKHSGFQLMLSGEEGQRSERILAYFNYLNEARQKNIDQLKQTRTELSIQKNSREQKQNQQKLVLNRQQSEQQILEQARKERSTTIANLDASLQKDRQKLAELKQNESRLRNQITQAEREAKARAQQEAKEAEKLRAKQKQAQRKGTTYTPTESERSLMARTGGLGRPAGQALWPVNGQILHHFGKPLQGELRWKGIVISAKEGSEVKAIADGRVLLADWLQGYGLMIVIEHGKTDMSLYGYNQSALVNVGDHVTAGQPIGLVGISGGQKQPSLYFEIRRQGQAVNPRPWLKN